MCTQPPNWSAATINYGDIGYLEVKPVIAGIDEWYDGDTQQNTDIIMSGLLSLSLKDLKT